MKSTTIQAALDAAAALHRDGKPTLANAVSDTISAERQARGALIRILEMAEKTLGDENADRQIALEYIESMAKRVLS